MKNPIGISKYVDIQHSKISVCLVLDWPTLKSSPLDWVGGGSQVIGWSGGRM